MKRKVMIKFLIFIAIGAGIIFASMAIISYTFGLRDLKFSRALTSTPFIYRNETSANHLYEDLLQDYRDDQGISKFFNIDDEHENIIATILLVPLTITNSELKEVSGITSNLFHSNGTARTIVGNVWYSDEYCGICIYLSGQWHVSATNGYIYYPLDLILDDIADFLDFLHPQPY